MSFQEYKYTLQHEVRVEVVGRVIVVKSLVLPAGAALRFEAKAKDGATLISGHLENGDKYTTERQFDVLRLFPDDLAANTDIKVTLQIGLGDFTTDRTVLETGGKPIPVENPAGAGGAPIPLRVAPTGDEHESVAFPVRNATDDDADKVPLEVNPGNGVYGKGVFPVYILYQPPTQIRGAPYYQDGDHEPVDTTPADPRSLNGYKIKYATSARGTCGVVGGYIAGNVPRNQTRIVGMQVANRAYDGRDNSALMRIRRVVLSLSSSATISDVNSISPYLNFMLRPQIPNIAIGTNANSLLTSGGGWNHGIAPGVVGANFPFSRDELFTTNAYYKIKQIAAGDVPVVPRPNGWYGIQLDAGVKTQAVFNNAMATYTDRALLVSADFSTPGFFAGNDSNDVEGGSLVFDYAESPVYLRAGEALFCGSEVSTGGQGDLTGMQTTVYFTYCGTDAPHI